MRQRPASLATGPAGPSPSHTASQGTRTLVDRPRRYPPAIAITRTSARHSVWPRRSLVSPNAAHQRRADAADWRDQLNDESLEWLTAARRMCLLPILPIGPNDGQFLDGSLIQATSVYAVTVRVRPWHVKSLDAADRAEQVLCRASIELVRRKNLGARQELEPRSRHDEMEVPRLRAYGAIAVGNLQPGGRYDLEPDPPAVAASAVRDHWHCRLTFRFSGRAPPCVPCRFVHNCTVPVVVIRLAQRCFESVDSRPPHCAPERPL